MLARAAVSASAAGAAAEGALKRGLNKFKRGKSYSICLLHFHFVWMRGEAPHLVIISSQLETAPTGVNAAKAWGIRGRRTTTEFLKLNKHSERADAGSHQHFCCLTPCLAAAGMEASASSRRQVRKEEAATGKKLSGQPATLRTATTNHPDKRGTEEMRVGL